MGDSRARRKDGRPTLSLVKPERGGDPSVDLSPAQRAVLDAIETQAKYQARFALIDGADVEDIAQQTMLAMWRKLQAEPRLWSDESEGDRDRLQFKITADAITDLRRYDEAMRGREPEEAIDLDTLPSRASSPHERLERKDFFHSLARMLETVAPRARLFWCSINLDELKPGEIAMQEATTSHAVSVSVYKTNRALRDMMRAEGYENPRESQS